MWGLKGTTELSLDRIIQSRSPTQPNPTQDHYWGDHPQSERVGEEERKRIILASSRKRADMLYPLKWKSIVLVFNKKNYLIYAVIGF